MGCGLESIHLFHEALSRQTKHVQFVVFEREDKNLEQPSQLLRDVNSFFLLAYFFPNCDSDDQSKGRYELLPEPGYPTEGGNGPLGEWYGCLGELLSLCIL